MKNIVEVTSKTKRRFKAS